MCMKNDASQQVFGVLLVGFLFSFVMFSAYGRELLRNPRKANENFSKNNCFSPK
eukprot:m.238192 g.238192  ORF g.238192 m.238192 type:complete len:54 (-) comp17113_c1_seq40:1759-1920(-)